MTIERIKDFISKKEEGISEVFEISHYDLDQIEKIITTNNGIFLSQDYFTKPSEDLRGYNDNLMAEIKKANKNLGAVYDYEREPDSYLIRIIYRK